MDRKKVFIFFEKAMGLWCFEFLARHADKIEIHAFTTGKELKDVPYVENPNAPEFLQKVRTIGPHLAFSTHCSKIFKKEILGLFSGGMVNLHPSLLPKHGGFFPTMWSIIEGDTKSGYTLHGIDTGIDTGPIIAQAVVDITNIDTGETLHAKQVAAGKKLFAEYALRIIDGDYSTTPQPPGQSCYHGKQLPFDGYIPWNETYAVIKRVIRAFFYTGFKGVLMKIEGRDVEMLDIEPAHPEISDLSVGDIAVRNGEVFARCLDATVRVILKEE